MNDLPDTIAGLVARVGALERRVAALESQPEAQSISAQPATASPEPAPLAEQLGSIAPGMVFSVLGRAMLGIAGAYVLRAAAESNLLPRPIAAALAIAYALAWLVWAARVSARNATLNPSWFAGAAYASTSALILAPMLWELTLRFNLLPAWGAAAVLAAYAAAATAFAWRRNLAPIYWVGNTAAIAVALSLTLASHAMEPYIVALLFIAALGEYAAARGREPGLLALTGLACDAAIWTAIYIYDSPPGTHADYPALGSATLIAQGFALFVLFAAGMLHRTVRRGKPITVFESIQTVIALLLAAIGLAVFGGPHAAATLGAICLVLSAAAYTAVFVFFDRAAQPSNYRIFATWSLALCLGGIFLSLPNNWRTPWLGAAAIGATFLGARFKRLALEFHGAVYLLAAGGAADGATFLVRVLTGSLPAAPRSNIYLLFAGAVFCYAVLRPRQDDSWQRQLLNVLFAALAIGGAAALAVSGLMALAKLGFEPGAHHLAFFRTLTVCVAALAAAYGGARWRRPELTRIGYTALGLMAIKLVAEDLRHGNLEYIAASIFLYALTLIAVPRISRLGQRG